MRRQEELYQAIDSIGVAELDPDRLFARVEAGAAARQKARSRRIAVVCVSAASVVIAAAAIVVPTLGADDADGRRVATTPTSSPVPGPTDPTGDQSPQVGSASPAIGFTPGPAPDGYTDELTYVGPGLESFMYESPSNSGPAPMIKMDLFDPELSGEPSPSTTDETVIINSATQGPLTAQVLDVENMYGEPAFGIGWQADADTWFTIISTAPDGQARALGLAAAEQVDLSVDTPLTFPFQIGALPDGFQPSGGSGLIGAGGRFQANLDLSDDPESMTIALQVSADNALENFVTFTPNTTVGPYEAQLSSDEFTGTTLAVLIDGFMVSIYVNEEYVDQIDEDALREVAGTLVIIDGAAQHASVWTDQPLG